ncbi:MAG: TrmH family RNA methyltransferase, partial [Rhodoferax sp.]
MNAPRAVSARDNPLLKELRKLVTGSLAYRKAGRFWVEGDHLCGAALLRGLRPAVAVFAESYLAQAPVSFVQTAVKSIVIPDVLFGQLSALESAARVGFVLDLPPEAALQPGVPTVILDRLQDAGNVGSVLRSAGAFGFRQVLALKGTAGLWSPKVLRAGMGAHFG